MKSIVFFVACFGAVSALPQWHGGRLVYDSKPKIQVEPAKDHYESFFVQRLDHYDRSINTTFKQRYFYNDTYWKGEENAPVFLCVGGEGPPLDRTVLVSSVHCNDMVEIAYKYNALLLALEHRYYGPSNPFDDYSTEHLQWLNSEQALGDIADFHAFITDKFSLKSTNRWITFGGSYPGMMAALARFRYPHLIWASVSSSSPLGAIVDFEGYNNVVAHSMAATDVGGSQACLNAIKDGHADIGTKLQTLEGRRELETSFNFCKPGTLEDPRNREQFAGDGVVYLPVQSNDPSCDSQYCDISSICTLMTDESIGTPIQRLISLSNAQHYGTCVTASYDGMIEFWKSPQNLDRTWIYQTCTEWGFYQTCNVGTECPYTQGLHTIDVDYDICQQAFGISKQEVVDQINFTLKTYGGMNLQSSRILFPSGEIDPWNAASILSAPNNQESTLWVVGASHHFWTHPSLPTDSAEVNAARQVIWAQVDKWLSE